MSRYPHVRKQVDVKFGPEDRRERFAAIAREHAEKLYLERGGERIEAAIARAENMLKVHDREVAKLLEGDAGSYRWKVSPSVVLRLERELDRRHEQREKLLDGCYAEAQRVTNETLLAEEVRNASGQRDAAQADESTEEQQTVEVEPAETTAAGIQPATGERRSAEQADTLAA